MSQVNFNIPNSNSSKIECVEKGQNDKKFYYDNDALMVNKGSILVCSALAGNNEIFDRWSSSFPMENKFINDVAFNITSYGQITGIFKQKPFSEIDAVSEFLFSKYKDIIFALIFAMPMGPVIGWLVQRYLNRLESKRQLKHLRIMRELVDKVYEENIQDKRKCIDLLNQKRIDNLAMLEGGIINDSIYHLIDERIFEYIKALEST